MPYHISSDILYKTLLSHRASTIVTLVFRAEVAACSKCCSTSGQGPCNTSLVCLGCFKFRVLPSQIALTSQWPQFTQPQSTGLSVLEAMQAATEVNNIKQLSYRKETALQGGSVLAKRVRRCSTDLSSTSVTQSASKAIEFCKITQNKGYFKYSVQGHLKSPSV